MRSRVPITEPPPCDASNPRFWTELRCSRCKYRRQHPGRVEPVDLDAECKLCGSPLGAVTQFRLTETVDSALRGRQTFEQRPFCDNRRKEKDAPRTLVDFDRPQRIALICEVLNTLTNGGAADLLPRSAPQGRRPLRRGAGRPRS